MCELRKSDFGQISAVLGGNDLTTAAEVPGPIELSHHDQMTEAIETSQITPPSWFMNHGFGPGIDRLNDRNRHHHGRPCQWLAPETIAFLLPWRCSPIRVR